MSGNCPTCGSARYNGTRHCHRPTCPKRRGAGAPRSRDRRRDAPQATASVIQGPWDTFEERVDVGDLGDDLPVPGGKK